MRTVAPAEFGFGMRLGQSVEQFARINTHAREIFIQAVGGVERDVQSVIWYSFSLR